MTESCTITFVQKSKIQDTNPISRHVVECYPGNTLLEVLEVLVESYEKKHLLFDLYNSHNERIYISKRSNPLFIDYLKTNQPIIIYIPKIPLKLRELPDNFDTWCLYHGFQINFDAIPELNQIGGFYNRMKLSEVCKELETHNIFHNQKVTFFDSDGELFYNVIFFL